MEERNFIPGDRVRVKSFKWYLKNRNKDGIVKLKNGYEFGPYFSRYCGCDAIITESKGSCVYKIQIINKKSGSFFNNDWSFTDEFFEGCVNDEYISDNENNSWIDSLITMEMIKSYNNSMSQLLL